MLRPKIHPAPCSPAVYKAAYADGIQKPDDINHIALNHLDKWLLLHHQTFWLARYLSCDWRSVQRDGKSVGPNRIDRVLLLGIGESSLATRASRPRPVRTYGEFPLSARKLVSR
ncbi:hypothetical protein KC347_g17 [Hortaea werneckii]|nr:hypothetical protein KC347_g17 [Hortaea werneckii]